MRKKQIVIDNRIVQYFIGNGSIQDSPIIFLHGWGSDAQIFSPIVSSCDNYIAIDLPGFGGSEIFKDSWKIRDYAIFLEKFLTRIDVKNPIIVGHSFGGSVGIQFCCLFGGRAKKLILVGSAGIRRKTIKNRILPVISKIFREIFLILGTNMYNFLRKKWYAFIGNDDYINAGIMQVVYKNVVQDDLRYLLTKLDLPVVLIWGENDTETPLRDAKEMKDLIPLSTLYLIPDAGHYVFLDQTKKFLEIFTPNTQI